MRTIEGILEEREKTHGKFCNHSRVSQGMKNIFYENISTQLSDIQMEAVDMIIHKIARIGCGNPNEVDHWRDIAGYATLVTRELEGGIGE